MFRAHNGLNLSVCLNSVVVRLDHPEFTPRPLEPRALLSKPLPTSLTWSSTTCSHVADACVGSEYILGRVSSRHVWGSFVPVPGAARWHALPDPVCPIHVWCLGFLAIAGSTLNRVATHWVEQPPAGMNYSQTAPGSPSIASCSLHSLSIAPGY